MEEWSSVRCKSSQQTKSDIKDCMSRMLMPSPVILSVFLLWFRQMLCLLYIELEVAPMKTIARCKIISVKQYWAKYWTLGDTGGDRPPTRLCATDYESLESALQAVLNPPHHLSTPHLLSSSMRIFLLFWKAGMIFAFSQPAGISPDDRNLSEMIVSVLFMVPLSSLSTHGCILPGLVDLLMLSLWPNTPRPGKSLPSNVLYPSLLGKRFLRVGLVGEDRCNEGIIWK